MAGAEAASSATPARLTPAAAAAWEAGTLAAASRATGPPVTITALPQVVNITIYRGMDFTLMIDVTGPDGGSFDVSARIIAAEIRAANGDLAGEWEPHVTGSTIVMHLPSEVSELLPASARWDVWLCDHPRTPLAAGTITTQPRVTQCPPAT